MIGTILSNRYKIIGKLGSGGMAWVYLARDLREQRQVAAKVLYPERSQDPGFLQRFMQEAHLAMSLSECNPGGHIVCVLDYGSDQDIHYLIMDYVPGRDLGQMLKEQGSLPWHEALAIARQVAMALAHANQLGIVHRDIKPGNIMIVAGGGVRVLDFGIARARGVPEPALAGFVGSPPYASPEQAMGKDVDIRADIYSLGIVLYRMLSGKLPYQGNTPWAIAHQHIVAPPPPLAEICPDLPRPVFALVQKAMAKRPEDRFQTPSEFIEAIARVEAGHEIAGDAPAIPAMSMDKIYEQAQAARRDGDWHQAVDLLHQILQADPGYRDAPDQLTHAGQQIRLAALYQLARRMVQLEQWEEARCRLEEIEAIAPHHRDVQALHERVLARLKAIAEEQAALSDVPTQIASPAAGYAPKSAILERKG